MKITHNAAAPTGAAQAEPLRPSYEAALRAGQLVGITLRTGRKPEGAVEVPVSVELGLLIYDLVLDYMEAEAQASRNRIAEIEGQIARNEALVAQKGGQAK